MDAHLFGDRVAEEGSLPEDGPLNRRRPLVYLQSVWYNSEDHERFPLCRFEDYLSLRGWDRDLIMRGQWGQAHPDNRDKRDEDCIFDTIAIIQAWMTFGFLEDLYQNKEWTRSYIRPLPEEMVQIMMQMHSEQKLWQRLRRNPAGEVLVFNTKNLLSNLATKAMRASRGLLGAQEIARLPILIGQFARAFNQLMGVNQYDATRNVTSCMIHPDLECGLHFFFILSLPKLIFEATQQKLGPYTPDIDLDSMTRTEQLAVQALREQNGWCPHLIERLYETTPASVVHWLWASDYNALDNRDHSGCSTSRCHALHVSSEAEYPEAHAEGCDRKCARYFPQVDGVLHALSQTCIPLIVAKPSTNDESGYEFNIISFDPEAAGSDNYYVAFSHVWSDGLGSTPEQGIPSCQAKYLARVSLAELTRGDGGTAFWIDSLCVPQAATARKKAIQLMASTYKHAHTVLVLDDTMRKVPFEDENGRMTSPELFLLRIYTSPWNQRVWTYQEGALARKLVFLLAKEQKIVLDFPATIDGAPRRGPLSLRLDRSWFRDVYIYLRAEVQTLNGQIRAINIGTVALQLRWRDTLHRDPQGRNDEILAVGNILGVDMKRLLDEPEGVGRMVLFYKLVGRLYRNIVFADVPRLQVDGFRWAPATFLNSDERKPHTNLEDRGVDCTEQGLLGTYVTLTVTDGNAVHYDGTRRITLVSDEISFDFVVSSEVAPSHNFRFTHVIIYPTEVPRSAKVPLFLAAAVLEDKDFQVTQQTTPSPDYVGVFQAVVHLCWLRERDTPVKLSSFPNGGLLVPCNVATQKLLLR